MSISEDYFKLITAIGSRNLLISMTTTPLPNNGKCDYKYSFFSLVFFFFSAWNVFPSLQNLQCDAERVSKKTNLPSDLRMIAANKGFFVVDNQASGNCLFHALSEQLQSIKGIQISHKELRKTLVQFLSENPNLVSS